MRVKHPLRIGTDPVRHPATGCSKDRQFLDVIMNKVTSEVLKTQRINVTFALKWMRQSPIYINTSMFAYTCSLIRPYMFVDSWSSFIYRSEYKGFYESLQIAFPNNVLVIQFCGWSLVCSIDIYIYILRFLIIVFLNGPRYVSHPPFLERSANLWAHWLCASTVFLWLSGRTLH